MTTITKIVIWAPRWRDRTVLIADWKIGLGLVDIDIQAKRKDGSLFYPQVIRVEAAWLKGFPIERINGKAMRAVPLDELIETERNVLT